jgi:hypothetical protein
MRDVMGERAARALRIALGVLIVGTAIFVVPAVARSAGPSGPAAAMAKAGCQPTTIDSLFPDGPAEAPTIDTDNLRSAAPDAPAPQPQRRCSYTYAMVHPIAVDAQVISSFGADRDGGARKHKGSDIGAPKLTPVVAVANGEVTWIRNEQGGDCCALAIRHDDGWRSYYIHLNNDTYGTDDGQGYGIAPGIDLGTRVTAGQLIGWVGDSGNAETAVPHLHFELRTPANVAIDAGPSLRNAVRLEASADEAPEGTTAGASSLLFAARPPLFAGAFADDDASSHASAVDMLASLGLVDACDVGALFCPDGAAMGDTVTAWLRGALDLARDPATQVEYSSDVDERALINQLSVGMEREEIRGCGERRYCADKALTRGEFAALLVAALEVDGWTSDDVFTDDNGHRFEDEIDLLVATGVFDTCARPGSPEFRPDDPITRGEVATFIARVIGVAETTDCAGIS